MRCIYGEWPGIRARVLDRDFLQQRAEILARVAFDRMKLLRVRMTDEIEPKQGIESHRVDYQRVALPMPHRMTVPGWIGIFGMSATVHKNLAIAVNVAFKKEIDIRRSFDDLPWIRRVARHARGEAIGFRIVLGEVLLSLARTTQSLCAFISSLTQSLRGTVSPDLSPSEISSMR